MALDVGLGRDIESVFVAQLVPTRVVGIVACAHGIDVQPLHYLYVLYHTLHTNHISAIWIKLMTVGSLDQHRLSVDKQLPASYLDIAESDPLLHNLYSLVTFLERHVQCIQLRCLRCPRLDILHYSLTLPRRQAGLALCRHRCTATIAFNSHFHTDTLAVHIYIDTEHTGPETAFFGQIRRDAYILDMTFRT